MEDIKNKVAASGLVNLDISDFRDASPRKGIDIKDFLYQGLILREKEFRKMIKDLDTKLYENKLVYVYCSVDSIVPLWAYFLLSSTLDTAKKVVFGNEKDLDVLLFHETIESTDFSYLKDKRVLVKGCSDFAIPENAYMELVRKLKPLVKSLMFGEACSNVPIFKN